MLKIVYFIGSIGLMHEMSFQAMQEEYLAGHVCELAGRIDLREEIRKTMMTPQISQLPSA